MVLHLTRQHIAQGQMRAFRTVNLKVIVGLKQRREKREALNVVPMRVGEKNGGRDRARGAGQQAVAQRSRASAAVQHQNSAGGRGQLHARRIAAEMVGAVAQAPRWTLGYPKSALAFWHIRSYNDGTPSVCVSRNFRTMPPMAMNLSRSAGFRK